MFKKILKFIFVEIFYNGHFQTLSSLAIVVFSAQVSNIKLTWDLLVIIYLVFYFIYIHDRYRWISIDALTNRIRTEHLKSFYKYIPYLMAIDLLILIFFLYYFSNIYFSIFILLILSVGYFYPLYFKSLTRKILIFKNLFVASVFALLVFVPFIYNSIPINQSGWLLIASLTFFIFIRGLMMQFFLDFKDIESDKKENLLTLSVTGEKEKVFKLLILMVITTPFILPILFFVFPNIFPVSVFFLLFLIPINLFYLHLVKQRNFFGHILESGEFIPMPILIYLGNLFL